MKKEINSKIGFCVSYHPFEENAENAPKIFQDTIELLKSIKDFQIIAADRLIYDINSAITVGEQFKQSDVDIICVKLATWSSDDFILDLNSICDVPFIFWTYPHMTAGSMCGGLQLNMVFKELHKECIFVYKDDNKALEKIKNYVISVSLRKQLKSLRFLKIGQRTQGMAEVICDEFSIKQIFGPRIISIGFENFYKNVNDISDQSALELWNEVKENVGKISVNDVEGIYAIKNYLVLRNIIDKEKLSGITIECYPEHMGVFCLAFSLLANQGIPGACEGDVNSLILMYILNKLSNNPVHNIDPLYLYEEDNSIIGSHCGCGSFKLAESKGNIELANVRLANKGLCILFSSKPGKVTLANLIGRKGTYRLAVIEGEAIHTEMVFSGNPIRIKLPFSIQKYLEVVEKFGLGHHWIIAYGHHCESLKYLASLLNMDYIEF